MCMHTYTINIFKVRRGRGKGRKGGRRGGRRNREKREDEQWEEEKVITEENGAKVMRSRGDACLQTLLNLN